MAVTVPVVAEVVDVSVLLEKRKRRSCDVACVPKPWLAPARASRSTRAVLLLQVRHGVRTRTCASCAAAASTISALGRVTSSTRACSSISLHSPLSRLAVLAAVSV